MKINNYDIVRIDWQDHYSNNSGWIGKADAEASSNLKQITCSSTGLVVKQDANSVLIAQNWHPPIDADSEWKFADFMVIIKGCIRKVTVYKKKEIK